MKGYYGDGKNMTYIPRSVAMTRAPCNRLLVIRDASSRFCQSRWPRIRHGGATRVYGWYLYPLSPVISLKYVSISSVVVRTQDADQRLYVAGAMLVPVKRHTMQYRRFTQVDKRQRSAKPERESLASLAVKGMLL